MLGKVAGVFLGMYSSFLSSFVLCLKGGVQSDGKDQGQPTILDEKSNKFLHLLHLFQTKQISLHLKLNVVKTVKKNIVTLDVSFRSLPTTSNLSGGGGGRGESWLHKAFINSSAFQRGGEE